MYGRQSSRVFDRKNAYFKPIEDDEMPCSSSSPTSASSPVSFWSSCAEQPGVSEDDLLLSLHEEGLHDRERMKLIGELIVSERDYVKDIETINSFFLQPLRKRRILPDTDVGQLFSTLPAIISLNKALLSAVVGSYTQAEAFNRSIDATVASLVQNKNAGGKAGHFGAIMTARGLISLSSVKRKECLIADAFQQMASYLKVYTTYSTRYVEAVAIIKRNKSANPAFEAFLEEVKGAPECRGRDMKTLMLRPVQRLCQYITVLDDLVRCTPRTHGDYHLLAQTAAKIQEVARDAEESLLTLQLAAKSSDDHPAHPHHNPPSPSPSGSGGRGSRGSGNGRRRKFSLSLEDQPARIERRRDSLADLPDLPNPVASTAAATTTTTATTSTNNSSSSSSSSSNDARRPKRQVSWRFSMGRVSALSPGAGPHSKSFSVGDCGNSAGGSGGESLLTLLEREKGAASVGGKAAGRRRSLKRGGSLTNTGAIKAQPRRVNSSASLCRSESATGSTFKGGLVC